MPKFKLIALSNAVEGAEIEFRRWYTQQHLPDVSAVPGVTGATFQSVAAGDSRWGYLAIYDIDAQEPTAVIAEIKKRSGTSLMPMSSALDVKDVYFSVFGAVSDA